MLRYANEKAVRSILTAIAGIFAGIFLYWEAATAGSIAWDSLAVWAKLVVVGGGPAGVALFVFNRWAWRCPGVKKLMTVPDIQGVWKGVEKSSTFGGELPVRARIQQSASAITFVAKLPASKNVSLVVDFLPRPDGPVLFVVYSNEKHGEEPAEAFREHLGTYRLSLSQPVGGKMTLSGDYWTHKRRKADDESSRGTAGTIALTQESTNVRDFDTP